MKTPCLKGLDSLAQTVVTWQRQHGRHDLPWQNTVDPYRIWLSEIMLQQTQVATVISYYERFLQRFPTVSSLAHADLDQVMPYWAGLGYYARARNLHRCAQTIVCTYNGSFPGTAKELATLPGIGRSTAAAIAAFAHGERTPIMDGNVKRVFTRYFGIYGEPNRRATETVLWNIAETALAQAPESLDVRSYTQGQMDLGATVCTRRNPECVACPLQPDCYAFRHDAQHTLPQKRTQKPLPRRQCSMLILEHQGHVLLQRQPSPGIWGGLWSLPKFDDDSDLEIALNNWQINPTEITNAESLIHTFSHFRLHIEPRHVVAPAHIAQLCDNRPDQSWIAVSRLPETALPAPVKTLLERLFTP